MFGSPQSCENSWTHSSLRAAPQPLDKVGDGNRREEVSSLRRILGSARSHRQGAASPGSRCCSKPGFHSFSKKASRAYCSLGTDRAGRWTDGKHRCGPCPTRNLLYSTRTQISQEETCKLVVWVVCSRKQTGNKDKKNGGQMSNLGGPL